MKKYILFLVVGVVLLVPSLVSATNYYIDPTGTDTGSCPISSPCKTLSYVDSLLNAGDTLYCRGGIYTTIDDYFQSARNGTVSNPITIKNYPGEIPVFRTVGHDFWGYNYIGYITHDWHIFEGLEFRPTSLTNGAYYGFFISGDHNVFRNITAVGIIKSDGVYSFRSAIFYLRSCEYNEFDSCTISGAGDSLSSMGQSGNLIIGWGSGVKYTKVHDCDLQKGMHDCIRFDGSYNEVYDNTFTHSIGYAVYFEAGSSRNIAERNIITGCNEVVNYVKNPIYIKGDYNIIRHNVGWDNKYYGFAQDGGDYNRIYNNVFYNNDNNGMWIYYRTSPEHNYFRNNVIAHNMVTGNWNQWYGEIADSYSAESYFVTSHDNQMKYNFIVAYVNGAWEDDYYRNVHIIYGGGQKRSVSYMETNYNTWSNNIYNYCDLKFTDPSTGDFTLQSGSCLEDAGTTLAVANGAGSNSVTLVVDDAGWFWNGDEIMINGLTTRTINSIDYNNHILTLDSPASWSNSDTVTLPYSGSFPDIGVYEYMQTGDTTPPVRSSGSPTGILPSGTTQTTLSLTTDESATCKYSTTPGLGYPSMTSTFTTTGGTTHSTTVSGLSDGNTYNYYIRCNDTSGNYNPDDYPISFSVASSYTADLNQDGLVNSVDFGIMMSYWGSTSYPSADINQDGAVNTIDFGIMMSQWG